MALSARKEVSSKKRVSCHRKTTTKRAKTKTDCPSGPCAPTGSSDKGLGSAATGYKPRAVAPARAQAMRLQWKPLKVQGRAGSEPGAVDMLPRSLGN